MPPFDIEKWKSDPKHEGERSAFEEMVKHSLTSIAEKEKAKNPPKPEEENMFDWLARAVFGGDSGKK